MKCKLTKECEIYGPSAGQDLIDQCERRGALLFAPIGTEIEDPDCFYLVLQCVAEAADDECREKTERTPEQIAAAEFAAKRLAAGIHPDDFGMYERGEIIGYTRDGEYVPGPNWKPPVVVDEEEELETETDRQ